MLDDISFFHSSTVVFFSLIPWGISGLSYVCLQELYSPGLTTKTFLDTPDLVVNLTPRTENHVETSLASHSVN